MPSSAQIDLIQRIDAAYRHWTGDGLPGPQTAPDERLAWLHQQAPYSLLAHASGEDPLFIYANHCAQQCFGYSFDEFVALPSRLSASPADRAERRQLLDKVTRQGIAQGYRGLRVDKYGDTFTLYDCAVWQIPGGGQGALFWPQPKRRPGWFTLQDPAKR
ncbi:MEKHLA domain-containing protein [Serratia quinivorans]|uniref:MEKHLA domain-containing protein n=1 Tax=Serratia quinivorans TaxID=137545 RepID=UPI003F990D22